MNLFSYNPLKPAMKSRFFRHIPIKKRLNNFGDLLGPVIVNELLHIFGYENCGEQQGGKKLLTIGSVIHFAENGDVVWGSGKNGKISDEIHAFDELDVRAVRGPLTRDYLIGKGVDAPALYGDPALLLPVVFPLLKDPVKKQYDHIFIPNYNDKNYVKTKVQTILPTQDLWFVIESIRKSRFVSSSSLHGIVAAEALGVPCRIVNSVKEDRFKYEDYFYGTGRQDICYAETPEEARQMGGHNLPEFSSDALLKAFPFDLFCAASAKE